MGVSTKEEWLRTHEGRIQQRAYSIWEQEGRPEGRRGAHWEQACRECADEDAHTGQPAASGANNALSKATDLVPATAIVGTGEPGKDDGEGAKPRAKATSGARA